MLIGVILVPILLVLSRGKPAAIFPPQALGVKSEEPQQKNRRCIESRKGSTSDAGHHQIQHWLSLVSRPAAELGPAVKGAGG
jgi:hypothetical protein